MQPNLMTNYKPLLCVVAGPNGSGKTTLTAQLFPYAKEHWNINIAINPDDIAKNDFGDYTTESHKKAAEKAQHLREQYVAQRTPFLFETVLSTSEKVLFLKQAQMMGFFVRMFFIGTNDPDINIQRVGARTRAKGHDVPCDKIVSRYNKSITNLLHCIRFLDYICVYDNSKDKQNPQKIFRAAYGKIVKQYSEANTTPHWCNKIIKISQLYYI